MIYMHCRSFSQAQMFAHVMTPCPTQPTTPSSFDDYFTSSTTTLSPYIGAFGPAMTLSYNDSNVSFAANDMRNSNNYGDGDDRFDANNSFESTTRSTLPSTTTARPTTAQTTISWPSFYTSSPSPTTPAVKIDRRELQSRVSDAIVDLWQSAEMRQLENVVADNTWEINERFNVLYKRNWTREARRELRQLERRLLQRVYTQIMMSIFGAGDLRANELSLDLDDSMVTEAPPEALSSAIMDEVRRPSQSRTTPSGRQRPRPPRNFDASSSLLLPIDYDSVDEDFGINNFNQTFFTPGDNQPMSLTNSPNKLLPVHERFKRQTLPLPQFSSNRSNAGSGSPTVGPPGRRRLSPFSLDTASPARPFDVMRLRNNNTATYANASSPGASENEENDAIASIDADDDDDVLLLGEEKVDTKPPNDDDDDDESSPPAREPPDYSQNNTDGTDYFSHRRRIGVKASDPDDELDAVTPAARNETVERLLEILHNQDWLLSDQQAHYFNRSVFDLVIFFEQNISNFILKEGYDGSMDRELWSFSGGLLFSLTVITTIGTSTFVITT